MRNLEKVNLILFFAFFLTSVFWYAPSQAEAIKTDAGQIIIASTSGDDGVNDPLESINRQIFGFNEVINQNLLGPVADAYNANLPRLFRVGVSNFLTNLSSPITIVNSLMQGEVTIALNLISRLLVNTTLGMGGIADIVSELDGQPRDEDFGQTLGVWGLGEGFYLVLPIFGPSSPRDAVGKFLIDSYFDPFGIWVNNTNRDAIAYSKQVIGGVDEFAGVVDELRQIRKTSVDYYAAVRSLYRQKRKSEISNGEDLDLPPIPNLGYELAPEDFEQPLAGGIKRSSVD